MARSILDERPKIAALLDAERAEEAVIEFAEAEGAEIARRPDASPLAVLGITVEGAAR